MPERPDDISSRMLVALRDYAAMKLGAAVAYPAFEAAVRELGCTVARATDPRAWVPLAVLENVARTFQDTVGPTFIQDTATWVVPARRDLSSMSLTAVTTPDVFYAHLDRARSFFARHLRFEMQRTGPGRYSAVLRYRDDVGRTSRISCAIARGILTSVPLLFELPPAKVEERACRCDGADACRYDVAFEDAAPVAVYASATGVVMALVGGQVHPSAGWLALPLAAWAVGREVQFARTRRLMARVTEEHRRVLAEHETEFQRRYDEMRALKEAVETRLTREGRGE